LPKTAEERLEKGQVANKAGNYDEAIKCFMKAVAINPNDANAHYNLGSAYVEKGEELNPLAADYLYKAGLLFLKQGNKEGALKAFKDLELTNSKEQEQDLYKKLHPEQADTKVNTLIDREKQRHLIRSWRKLTPPGAVFQNKFLGISTVQHPFDVWITQEIISEVKPDLIIEAGTYHGGSALLWAMFLENINSNGRVITIDIKDQRTQRAIDLPIAKRRVDFLLGSSTDPEIVAEVSRRAKGKKVLVILDSLHKREHVLNELKAYSPLVSLGSYIIVQDTPVGGIRRAIREFLSGNDSFLVDHRRERFVLTNNVDGYLKRVR
jgi:cephalosporin hydroxylase